MDDDDDVPRRAAPTVVEKKKVPGIAGSALAKYAVPKAQIEAAVAAKPVHKTAPVPKKRPADIDDDDDELEVLTRAPPPKTKAAAPPTATQKLLGIAGGNVKAQPVAKSAPAPQARSRPPPPPRKKARVKVPVVIEEEDDSDDEDYEEESGESRPSLDDDDDDDDDDDEDDDEEDEEDEDEDDSIEASEDEDDEGEADLEDEMKEVALDDDAPDEMHVHNLKTGVSKFKENKQGEETTAFHIAYEGHFSYMFYTYLYARLEDILKGETRGAPGDPPPMKPTQITKLIKIKKGSIAFAQTLAEVRKEIMGLLLAGLKDPAHKTLCKEAASALKFNRLVTIPLEEMVQRVPKLTDPPGVDICTGTGARVLTDQKIAGQRGVFVQYSMLSKSTDGKFSTTKYANAVHSKEFMAFLTALRFIMRFDDIVRCEICKTLLAEYGKDNDLLPGPLIKRYLDVDQRRTIQGWANTYLRNLAHAWRVLSRVASPIPRRLPPLMQEALDLSGGNPKRGAPADPKRGDPR